MIPNAVYSLARLLILAILVNSEGMLAQRKRSGFETHLILFSVSLLLFISELYIIALDCFSHILDWPVPNGAWAWYPILQTIAFMGIAFRFDFDESQDTEELRIHAQHYLIFTGILFGLGALMSGLDFSGAGTHAPTSIAQIHGMGIVLHGLQAFAIAILAWKATESGSQWLSDIERRVFLTGCLAAFIGFLNQMSSGPQEHLTTVAYVLFVGVIMRDNYRRSVIGAARAYEDSGAKMLLFHRITTQLKSSFDLDRLYEILMDSLLSNLGAESGAIYLRHGIEGSLKPEFVHGPYPPPFPLPDWVPDDLKVVRKVVRETEVIPGDGIIGKVAENGTPLYLYDKTDVQRHYTWPVHIININTAIALPLRSPEGIYGVIQVVNRLDGSMFSEEDLRFMSLLVEQAGLAIYNARLHAERLERQRSQEQIKIARNIQLRLLPSKLPEIPGIAVGAQYDAAQEVGGDYYDIYRIDHDHLGLIVFDVAGKGVPGALLMAITATFLKMAAPRSQSPAWVLNEVNAALSAESHRGLFVTAIYGVLKISTGELQLCSAGHPAALIIRNDGAVCESIKPRGAALGLLRPNRFRTSLEQATLKLAPGDTLLLYTDGVLEARNAEAEEFDADRLEEIAKAQSRHGPRKLTEEIIGAVREHAGDEPQYDDTTVLALRMLPPGMPPDRSQQ
jgi:serine phosphatase RsbU (regulator of sigma subunit)